MEFNLIDFAVVALLITAGCAASFFLSQRALRRTILRQQDEMEQRIDALNAALKALDARIVLFPTPPVQITAITTEASAPSLVGEALREQEQVSPEILAVIVAAATALMSRRIRLRSARALQSPLEAASAWSQQGRVFIQTSHNLHLRG